MRNTPTPIETSPEPSNGRSQVNSSQDSHQPNTPQSPRNGSPANITPSTPFKPQRRRWRWWVAGGVAIALIGGGVTIWHRQNHAAVVSANSEQQTETVEVQDLTIQIEASGTVLPINT
ncbi:MAG: hypothetical protein AAGF24_13860, partial [Cyanobacteria bacterium P01_H01_bin.121]